MFKKFAIMMVVVVLAVVAFMPSTSSAQEPVVVTWFIGLGAGGQPEQVAAQESVAAAFNESHDDIELEIVIVNNEVATDTLNTLLASGEAPDIVGPVGIKGTNAFEGNWLDLQPLVDETGYDLTQFPEAAVNFYRVEGAGLVGLPFGFFPSVIYFNRDLFDQAGLDYPPQEYGVPYADGDTWDFAKLEEIGMLLTLDANGNDAFSPDFDPENIVQFGFMTQWNNATRMASQFGGGSFVDADGNAVLPEHWAEYFRWNYSGIWEKHFIPNASQTGSDLLAAGNPFNSGNLAMATSHLWYTCCLADVPNWDMAVVPEYNGVPTAPLHADTFRIMSATDTPNEAFEVLTYLVGDAAMELLTVYGGMPVDAENQAAYFATMDETYPQGVNWQVAIDSLNYPDIPSHEAWTPNFTKADNRINAFQALFESTPDLDIDAEMNTLVTDLQAIFDEVAE